MVAPALEKYSQDRLLGEVWKRPGLTPRDRSIVTLAAPIARSQTIEMPYYLNIALDNGLKPREISEIITHLAFYSGWPNAMSAVAAAKDLFAQRQIGSDELPPASPQLLPLDVAAEAQRASRVGEQFGSVAPGVVQYTTDVQDIRPGDVVWIPPGQKHWHGATATIGMTHIAIQEYLNGATVEWMEKVSDEQYRR